MAFFNFCRFAAFSTGYVRHATQVCDEHGAKMEYKIGDAWRDSTSVPPHAVQTYELHLLRRKPLPPEEPLQAAHFFACPALLFVWGVRFFPLLCRRKGAVTRMIAKMRTKRIVADVRLACWWP